MRRDRIARQTLLRLTTSTLAVFTTVITVLSAVAYRFIENNYRSIVGPALATPEGRSGLAAAMRPALAAIVSFDVALLVVVGVASYVLARVALRPLELARLREEHFAADAAHELRTPLGAIASLAQAVTPSDTDAVRVALETISRRALQGGRLIGDLLILAREDDPHALIREPVDVRAIVDAVVAEIDARVPPITIFVEGTSVVVDADERRLRSLVQNLIVNARAHARSRVVVSITAHGGRATLVVDDDGPGVASDLAPRLFERFAKGTNSQGSGLGLAICRWIAHAHGGEIHHTGGARFVVTLPALHGDGDVRS